jgi:glycosyltransferase involved in cell wall biosynthesis
MTLVINGRFLSQKITGVQRVAHQISSILLKTRRNVKIIAPPNAQGWPEEWPVQRVGSVTGYLWEQTVLPYAAAGATLLSLCNVGPVLHRRHVVMIHDAAMYDTPENYGLAMRTAYRILLPLLGRTARRIVTVSQFSKDRLVRNGVAPAARIEVGCNGINHVRGVQPGTAVLEKFGLSERGYVLAVGPGSRNKNVGLVVAALEKLGQSTPQLVLVGAGADGVFARNSTLKDDRVKALGYLEDSDLMGLYSNALCLAFPSYYEGFGLPPLEAMALGCPVIVSDRASLPEICGDAALICGADDIEGMAAHIHALSTEPGLRDTMIERGYERAATFTWERAAGVVSRVIDEIEA